MSDSHLYMAMDLITGGNLGGDYKCAGEDQAAVIVRQIIRALRYLHDRNIAASPRPRFVRAGVGSGCALSVTGEGQRPPS